MAAHVKKREARSDARLPACPRPTKPAPAESRTQSARPQPRSEPPDRLERRPNDYPFGGILNRLVRWVHPGKHADAPGPNTVTHERPFAEWQASLPFGVVVGLTVSELHQVRRQKGIEFLHVVGKDGGTNLELVLARKQIGAGQRVELQGPGLNTSTAAGAPPVGLRLLGVGLTGDLVDRQAHEAASYTLETKLTGRTAAELAALATPGAAAEAAALLGEGAAAEVARIASGVLASAVPIVGGVIALSTARWAARVVRDGSATPAQKALAVAHAVADAVRIAFPLVGVIANSALVGLSFCMQYSKLRRARGGGAPRSTAERAAAKVTPGEGQR